MALQPFADLRAALHALLQLLQRAPAGLGLTARLLRLVHVLLDLAAARFQFGQALLRGHDTFLRRGDVFVQRLVLGLLERDLFLVRLHQRRGFLLQALAPAADVEQRALGVGLVRFLDTQLLLGFSDGGTLGVDRLLCGALCLLDQRQAFLLGFQTHLGLFGTLVGEAGELAPAALVAVGLLQLRLPLLLLGLELDDALLEILLRLAAMAEFGFQPCHLGIGGEQFALRVVHPVGGAEMLLAGRFQLGLDLAQAGVLAFELVRGALDIALGAFALRLRLVALEQPQQLLLLRQFVVEFVVLAGDRGLCLEALHLGAELDADVLDAGQVLARVGDATLGFLAPLLVTGDAGGFLEEDAQLVRLRLDDARDHALADDGVGARAKAGAEEQVGDVLAAHLQVVDVVLGLAVARQHALDRELGVLRPLPGGTAERIVEDQFDGGTRHRLALAGAVEDHVLHRFAAQFGGFRFAEHPAHGVHHVGFSAAVGADDADQLPRQGDGGGVDEGFETGEFELCQAHVGNLGCFLGQAPRNEGL